MILYLDTSALVKLYADEVSSGLVRDAVAAAAAVATHVISYVEARAALARKVRERALPPTQWARCKADLDADWPLLDIIGIDDPLRLRAAELAEHHSLRGFDSLHLAAAEFAFDAAASRDGFRFAVFDHRLREAASARGLPLLV